MFPISTAFENNTTPISVSTFSNQEMVLGMISDSLRAILLCYLFPQLKHAGESIGVGIKFGLTISAIMSTLWLIFGYFELKLEDPNFFLIFDGIIFIIQGILSGIGLHILSKRKLI
ncbi:MAG: hypothetical protein IPQ02_14145 [Saprospiraceae bacterium]|nr:hypothetical protein [Candidatus Defluviibacterium haderslevense]